MVPYQGSASDVTQFIIQDNVSFPLQRREKTVKDARHVSDNNHVFAAAITQTSVYVLIFP